MPVSDQKPEYTQSLPKWQIVRDCDEGATAVKLRSKSGSTSSLNGRAGTAYLPAPNPSDTSSDNKERYDAYKERASFVNFTSHTKEGMLGMVFRKPSRVELPPETEYLIENANGGGLSADQMIKDVTSDALMLGRYGLLSDYPETPEGLTDADVTNLNLRANILPYPAESIINWRTETIGGIKKLSMVVLREPIEKIAEDGFSTESATHYRVLLLKEIDDKLIYVQNVYDDDEKLIQWPTGETDEDGQPVFTGDIIPRKSDKSNWGEIPFVFIGSINNDETADKAPLYDIAEINIAHYRNSADYEESSFLVGQPTPAIAGLTQSWVDKNLSNGVQLGSRGAILLPEGGSASLLQSGENQMPLKGMEIKETQLVKVGARIIQDNSGVETAEAAKIRFSGQNSKLGSIIINVEAGFIKAFSWAGEFMGNTKDPEVEINKELYDATLDPQMIISAIQLLDRGVWAKSDLQDLTRNSGLIRHDRTNDDIDSEAEGANII